MILPMIFAKPAGRSLKGLAAAALLLFDASALAFGSPVPVRFRGDWIAADASCAASLRLRIGESDVTLMSADLQRRFSDLELCDTCDIGAHRTGLTTWLIPEFGNRPSPPFAVFLDADARPPVASIEMHRDSLREQFPLEHKSLRKCPPSSAR